MTTEIVRSEHGRLRVCFVMLHYAREVDARDLRGYLTRTPIHHALPIELAARGHDVHLVHSWPLDATLNEQGVHFHFVAEPRFASAVSNLLGATRRRDPVTYLPGRRAVRLVRSLQPDVVHFHGSTLDLNLALLRRALSSPKPIVTLHYHGGYPPRHPIARRLQRRNFDRADRLCFTTVEHARPFEAAETLRHPERVVELVETSSTFEPRDRDAAREVTGMSGEPVFVSVGRLHPIKDPLTTLQGFAEVLCERPEAQFYLYYTSTERLPDIQAYLAQMPALRDHVHLRGRADYDQMEAIYNSADFLLQASLREFSGCAVLEAMACGVIPIVTDIPSFRAMTAGGRYGRLFPIGRSNELARQVLSLPAKTLWGLRADVRGHFERALSFRHMAESLERTWVELLPAQHRQPARELVVT
jgi:glycosyltransferase involved in cell wall biosynthesis